jgi:YVTN family beta-propeller protein
MRGRLISALIALLVSPVSQALAKSFVTFETGQVRPLAVSPSGTRLFALNTPDGRLEIFDIQAGGLSHAGSVPVGMEPVAVAARTEDEVWVVNHLSDSVSIVDVPTRRVVRTLLVGDEPRDIVFAGPGMSRAFITTAHRGQHRTDPSLAGVPGAGDPRLTKPGIPRADVWVFDARNPGSAFCGKPLKIIELFGDTPRALAASPDGSTVYAAIFDSGNQTTALFQQFVCSGFDPNKKCVNFAGVMPGGNPGPDTSHDGTPAVEVGLIVKFNKQSGKWEDELHRDWSQAVRFNLPDKDVFAIDASTLTEAKYYTGVGTILFNMAVNPVSKKVYVSNSEARNDVRFEGPGTYVSSLGGKPSGAPPTVQGHLHEMRITVLDGANVLPRHLNKHIDYSIRPARPGTKEHSLSIPLGMAVSEDGKKLYVAAFGSSKIGVFDTATLENDTFDPTVESANYITVSGGGPSGIVLDPDETTKRLYALTRFDDSISVIDLATRSETQKIAMHNPEPEAVKIGRPFLYDAQLSSNGEASCASCHVFGDFDSLSWDLGNPDNDLIPIPMPINEEQLAPFLFPTLIFPVINGTGNIREYNPMKGPMSTQTLRGMVNHGSMHWRGDRTGGNDKPGRVHCDDDPTAGHCDSEAAFKKFVIAFDGLLGRDTPVDPADMQKFSDFILQITQPPNAVRALDNSLTRKQQKGREFFVGRPLLGVPLLSFLGPRKADGFPLFFQESNFTCEGCHRLKPEKGFFGTDGTASFEGESQIIKIPNLRNLYQKVGMFGMPPTLFINPGNNFHKGDQVRGTGYLHEGALDTVFRFLNNIGFDNTGTQGFELGARQRRQVEAFLFAFDNDVAPIVGQQVTLTPANRSDPDIRSRIDLLLARANAPFVSKILGGSVTECDLVVKGNIGGKAHGWRHIAGGNTFEPDDGSVAIADDDLRALAATPGQELTYTCLPPGSGVRGGIDRDEDGVPDGLDNCPDVANPDQADGNGNGVGDACE